MQKTWKTSEQTSECNNCVADPVIENNSQLSYSLLLILVDYYYHTRDYKLIMSDDSVITCCASCGKAEVDDVKLKKCSCLLVKYCSVECQKNHRPQHKKACKKRLAELRDDKLFKQPDESHLGECSICCLPLPLGVKKLTMLDCCSKIICGGCALANRRREREGGLKQRCAFCRAPLPKNKEEALQNMMKRVKANDPVAMREMGRKCCIEGDNEGGFEYFTKATALGDIESHQYLADLYHMGKGVEKDPKKKLFHMEEAAIGGHHVARFNLGIEERDNERAVKHFIIAAKLGFGGALEQVKERFAHGLVSKEDFEAALRGHQAAVDATKSKQREEADAHMKNH